MSAAQSAYKQGAIETLEIEVDKEEKERERDVTVVPAVDKDKTLGRISPVRR